MGRDVQQGMLYVEFEDFNPRARMGRDRKALGLTQTELAISIHAPVWGATEVTL